MLIARRYVVRGRVQGVGFRAFVQDAGAIEGLRGWVRNLDDGAVEIGAEGEGQSLARFERRLASGPARARVASVEVHDDTPGGRRPGFHIR